MKRRHTQKRSSNRKFSKINSNWYNPFRELFNKFAANQMEIEKDIPREQKTRRDRVRSMNRRTTNK